MRIGTANIAMMMRLRKDLLSLKPEQQDERVIAGP